MILETAASNCLSKAVMLWRSDNLKHEALGKIEEFLSRVSRKQLKKIEWAIPACRIIVLGSAGLEGVLHMEPLKADVWGV